MALRFVCSALLLITVPAWQHHQQSPPVSPLNRVNIAGPLGEASRKAAALLIASTLLPQKAQASRMRMSTGSTNEVVDVVEGIRQKRLGSGDIFVSEIGLGTQRWVSDDSNAPNEQQCFAMMDRAILHGGVNLIDTAEQYPIPSSQKNPEGLVEKTIGKWMAQSKGRREKVVIATKITGGRNINRENLKTACEASLQRLGTDYIDVYLLHWPARYTPQSNWGQSLEYAGEVEPYYKNNARFEEIVAGMGDLMKAGKIRGWGMCNDNCFGLTSSYYVAKAMGISPPVCLQNDYSILNRRIGR